MVDFSGINVAKYTVRPMDPNRHEFLLTQAADLLEQSIIMKPDFKQVDMLCLVFLARNVVVLFFFFESNNIPYLSMSYSDTPVYRHCWIFD